MKSRLQLLVKKQTQNTQLTILRKQSTDLKLILSEKIAAHRKVVNNFRSKYGTTIVGEVTVDAMYGGLRGVKGLICETSSLDLDEGIRFRGLSIPECRKVLPKAKGGLEPLPEGIFWLLLTGEIPTEEQAKSISRDWARRSELPSHIEVMLRNFPKALHPTSQLSSAITALNTESKFVKAYAEGVQKSTYWEYTLEDAMDLAAKIPVIAATIYRNVFRDGKLSAGMNPNLDWTGNFLRMLGFHNPEFYEMMRLFMTIHSDHEAGNAFAHTVHLVGSTLSDPYLSVAAGINALAGPLHGLASQEVMIWIDKLQKAVGNDPSEEQLKDFVWKSLKDGQVIPGFGHAVLRKTDPRYDALNDFAQKHISHDNLFNLGSKVHKVVPPIMMKLGKVKNPWPNTDAHAGVLFRHYGMTETKFFPILLAVSRTLGVLSQLVWSRALGLPIERPKSSTTEDLMKNLKSKMK